jgi:hypothetical protein
MPSSIMPSQIPQHWCGARPSPEFIARALASWEKLPEKQINITFLCDNLEMPKCFNRRAVEQCYRHVYCTAKDGFLLA